MYTLAIPSAKSLAGDAVANGVQMINLIDEINRLIACDISHMWFYILDEVLDGVPYGINRFIDNIESAMLVNPVEPDDFRQSKFLINYNEITSLIRFIGERMIENITIALNHDIMLRLYSNSLSHLKYIDDATLVVLFFNNLAEKERYVGTPF